MRLIFATLGALIMSQSALPEDYVRPDLPLRPAHTYSIVARDAETSQMGVAVQSHWFSTGSVVTWAQAGVGAVATQSFVEISYGPKGLELMAQGKSPQEALDTLMAKDEHTNVRQVAMVDTSGSVATHTGEKAILHRCHLQGDGFSVQANMMENDTVCTAMKAAYESAEGDLAERLMVALEAAEGEGGDVRGKQSAAMLIVDAEKHENPWEGRLIDLRVDDHEAPLVELRRLVRVAKTYAFMTKGDELMEDGKTQEAMEAYEAAEKLSPENHEAIFWHGATLAAIGEVEAAKPLLKKAYEMEPNWKKLITRLPAAGLLPEDPELMEELIAAMEG